MLRVINNISLVCLLWLAFSSCEKEEELWTLPPAGNETFATVEMGENYENVIYYKLKTNQTIIRKADAWDLAFNSNTANPYISMNGGNGVQVYNTHDTDFAKTTYTAALNSPWVWDNPNGDLDSTAFGKWFLASGESLKETYILDLGATTTPRYIKMQMISVAGNTYNFKFANIDNSGLTETSISSTDTTRNAVYYKFGTNSTINFEPVSSDWDFVFTKYRHVYYDMDPITPYSVTGVILNKKYTTIYETSTVAFESITYSTISQFTLTDKADEIGYDWKFFDLNGTGKYSVNDKKVYVLKDKDGVYYKLKFVGFYNKNGIKGSPQFVFQRL